jgi:hypothetical protein
LAVVLEPGVILILQVVVVVVAVAAILMELAVGKA